MRNLNANINLTVPCLHYLKYKTDSIIIYNRGGGMKMKCEKHPKYKGNRKPKYQCVDCLYLYVTLRTTHRVLPMPTKVIPDKTKYNRKKNKGKDYE